jgi:hypothetical protein
MKLRYERRVFLMALAHFERLYPGAIRGTIKVADRCRHRVRRAHTERR